MRYKDIDIMSFAFMALRQLAETPSEEPIDWDLNIKKASDMALYVLTFANGTIKAVDVTGLKGKELLLRILKEVWGIS